MEISGIVQYEKLFSLELLHPNTDESLGITCQIRSAGSKEAKAVLRQITDQNLERSQKRKIIKGATLERQEIEKAAAYVVSWNWGKNTWQGKVPAFSSQTVIEVMEAEGWFFGQVVEAATSIANFSTASATA